jgi:hypothetical protein
MFKKLFNRLGAHATPAYEDPKEITANHWSENMAGSKCVLAASILAGGAGNPETLLPTRLPRK